MWISVCRQFTVYLGEKSRTERKNSLLSQISVSTPTATCSDEAISIDRSDGATWRAFLTRIPMRSDGESRETKPEERCSPVSDPWSRVLETRIEVVPSKALNRERTSRARALRVVFREGWFSIEMVGPGPHVTELLSVPFSLVRMIPPVGSSPLCRHPRTQTEIVTRVRRREVPLDPGTTSPSKRRGRPQRASQTAGLGTPQSSRPSGQTAFGVATT